MLFFFVVDKMLFLLLFYLSTNSNRCFSEDGMGGSSGDVVVHILSDLSLLTVE